MKIQLVHTGLHLIATNRYIEFLPKILESINKHFFPRTLRHVIIYTNVSKVDEMYSKYPELNIHTIMIPNEPWPYVTLKRFHYFSLCRVPLHYSFYCDVDSIMCNTIDYFMLTDRLFGTMHPGWAGSKGTVCTDPDSAAYIPEGENQIYYCGGFFGGPHSKFMEMTLILKNRIQSDMDKNVMAEFHDESHLNWYFWKHPPSTLNYPFAVQEGGPMYKETCVVFLDKALRGGHTFFREPPPVRFKLSSSGFRGY